MSARRLHRDRGLAGLLEQLKHKGPSGALPRFRALLRQKPRDPGFETWIERGSASFDPSGRHDLDRLAAEADELVIDLLFARVLLGTGHEAEALSAVRAVVEHAPGRSEPRFLLCAMLLKRADPEAQVVLQHCLARCPPASPGWEDLGEVLADLGKPEAALVCLRRAAPDLAVAMRRGQIAKGLGRLDEAQAAFAEALRLAPRAARPWFLLGTCAQDRRDFDAATQAYEAALALEPGLAEAAVNLGTVRQEKGDLEGAKAAYRQAVQTRADTFGRVAQALSTSPHGELWLDLRYLRRVLGG